MGTMIVAGVTLEISNPTHVLQQVRELRPESQPVVLGITHDGKQATVVIPFGCPVIIYG